MRKQKFLSRIFFLPIILLLFSTGSLTGSEDPQHYIIDVIGHSTAINCSKSFTFAEYYSIDENDTLTLPVSEGDLIYFPFLGDENFFYRYNSSDGLNLSIRSDSIYNRFYLNSKVISVSLSEGSEAWDWLEMIDDETLRDIRSFFITLPLSEDEINSLKMISGFTSNPGFFFEGDSLLAEVLSVINPGWLIVEYLNYHSLSDDAKANLKNLEFLWCTGADTVDPAFLYSLPELNSLILEYWNSTAISDFQFEKLKSLESLSIVDSDIHDLSSISTSSSIRNLNLIYCEKLKQIGSVANLTGITSLGFAGCHNIDDIPVILQMPSLTRLSIPGNTTQEEFTDIIDRHNTLQVLEMIECDTIEDLSPLEEYFGLKSLTLDFDLPDLKPIFQLSGLELLVLTEEIFEDSLALAEIQQAMPGTRIVAGGAFCLGSGWVLILIPMIIILLILRINILRVRLARTNK